MAKSPDKVQTFLRDLSTKLQPLWAKERQQFLALKEQECKENGWEFNGKLDPWDSTYYTQRVEETEYSIKREEYRAYFPLEHVTAGLLDIYQQLLQLKFTLLPDAPTWHSDVQAVSCFHLMTY
jgi:thimet oligopeptidase